mgnify:CR=1 FL=1
MIINLITEEEYNTLLDIQKNHPVLTFQKTGYEYIDKSKLTDDDKNALEIINTILSKAIEGFSKFFNYRYSKSNEIEIRFDYDWSLTWNNDRDKTIMREGIPFTGVGYLYLDELLNGFRVKQF